MGACVGGGVSAGVVGACVGGAEAGVGVAASGWQHEPKRLPKKFLLGSRERPKNVIFAVRSCLGARMAPKSPQAFIFEAFLVNFGSLFAVF